MYPPYRKSISLNSKWYRYLPYNLYIKQVQFDWYKEENTLFPIGNYFNFTERQFNWCHLLIFCKTLSRHNNKHMNLNWIRWTKSNDCTTVLFLPIRVRDFCITKFILWMRGCDEMVIFWKIICCSLTKTN